MHLIIFNETSTIYMLSKHVQSGATRVWHTHKHPMQRTSRPCTKIVTRLRQTTEKNEPQYTPAFFIVIGFKIVSFHVASLASTNRIPVRHSAAAPLGQRSPPHVPKVAGIPTENVYLNFLTF
jgi:hypothetical protein